jgi:acetylornithine deacetylase
MHFMVIPPPSFFQDLSYGHQLRLILGRLRPLMRDLLRETIRRPSVSGDEAAFVKFIETWTRDQGLSTECAAADEEKLTGYPQASQPHLPLAGRPLLLVRQPGCREGRSLLFNAHSDVVPAGDPRAWTHPPWSGAEEGGRIYGRGAVDVKGPLVSALWAMLALGEWIPRDQRGDVLLELIPGEEDCVGLGTLASVVRGVTADAVIVLEPTECQPRCAARAGCRFRIEAGGRAAHGTVKWLGVDAIAIMRRVLDALERLEARWNDPCADPLFAAYPIARPVTVDKIAGGEGRGMIADCCRCDGYLELLPGDSIAERKRLFEEELMAEFGPFITQRGGWVTISFGEQYDGFLMPPEAPLGRLAAAVAEGMRNAEELRIADCGLRIDQQDKKAGNDKFQLIGFNSGCEAGLRAGLEGTPTLVWGPGSLAQAHAADESIALEEVEQVAVMFAEFAARWTACRGDLADGDDNQTQDGARRPGQP